ncbi:MAG: IS4 family transposase, partial [Cyanobacteria bacterium P01_C01_bin.72]
SNLEVLKAKTRQKLPTILTVAYLGGYLEHRRQTPIGIQVLWRGWLKLHDLCEGCELARNT